MSYSTYLHKMLNLPFLCVPTSSLAEIIVYMLSEPSVAPSVSTLGATGTRIHISCLPKYNWLIKLILI